MVEMLYDEAMSRPLKHYLRTYRKRSGLTQADVAKLLGSKSSSRVCRYERFQQEPTLRTALAYQILFRTPIRELFAGAYAEVKTDVGKRAQNLAQDKKIPERKREKFRLFAVLEPGLAGN
jgi:transcriptional regulator with XRE-family HTH domain